jgi:hypothetical protein
MVHPFAIAQKHSSPCRKVIGPEGMDDGQPSQPQPAARPGQPPLAASTPSIAGGGASDLDRQHMPGGRRRTRLFAPAFNQAFDRHFIVGQQAMETELLRPLALAQRAHTNVLARDHAIEQHRPIYQGDVPRTDPDTVFQPTWRHRESMRSVED